MKKRHRERSFNHKMSNNDVTITLSIASARNNLTQRAVRFKNGSRNSQDRTCERVTDISIFFLSGQWRRREITDGWPSIRALVSSSSLSKKLSPACHPFVLHPCPNHSRGAILTTVRRVSVFAVTSGSFLLSFQGFPAHLLRKWSLFILTRSSPTFLYFMLLGT